MELTKECDQVLFDDIIWDSYPTENSHTDRCSAAFYCCIVLYVCKSY